MNSPKIYKGSVVQELTSTAAENQSFPTINNSFWPGQKTKGKKMFSLHSDKGAGF